MASGHVRKRTTKAGGTVWGVIVNRDRDPVTGKRRRTAHGSYRTKAEAPTALRRILTEIDSGVFFVERTDLTVGGYITNVWWSAHIPTIRANTAASYDRVIAARIIPGLWSARLQKLTPAMLTGHPGDTSEGAQDNDGAHVSRAVLWRPPGRARRSLR